MLINLTDVVEPHSFCKIGVFGDNTPKIKELCFSFSQEAVLGFATELLDLYEDINENEKRIIETHPLVKDPAPSQAIGFYLTPHSPELMIRVNYLCAGNCSSVSMFKEIEVECKDCNRFYNIAECSDACELERKGYMCFASYEIGKRNLANIDALDENGIDVTERFPSVVIDLSKEGIKDFATMLFVWADNCKDNTDYLLHKEGSGEMGYNFGIVLTNDSVSTRFRIKELGTKSDYEMEKSID